MEFKTLYCSIMVETKEKIVIVIFFVVQNHLRWTQRLFSENYFEAFLTVGTKNCFPPFPHVNQAEMKRKKEVMGFNGTCEKRNICCIAALSAAERMHESCHVVGVNFSIKPTWK